MKRFTPAILLFAFAFFTILNTACEDSTSSRKNLSEIPTWWSEFGIGINDHGHAVVADNDGGFVAVGYSQREATGDDLYLVKVDSLGSMIFQEPYGGTGTDLGDGICLANEGGYMLCGRTSSFDSYDLDAYMIHADDSGNGIWSKNYSAPGFQFVYDIVACDDGGYVVAGQTTTPENGKQVWIVKFASDGGILWQKDAGGTEREDSRGIIHTDSAYMVAGVTESFGNGMQVYLVKFDDTGKFLWEKNYGGEALDIALDLANAPGGGCWLAGYTTSKGAGSDDGYIMRISSDGDLIADYTFGGWGREVFYGVTATSDGGCVAVGENYSVTGDQDCYAVRLDYRGRTLFEKTYHVNLRQLGADVVSTLDGGFIMTGETYYSYDVGDKLFMLKINGSGDADLINKVTDSE